MVKNCGKKITSPKKIKKKAKVIHLKNSTFNKLTQPANPPPQIYSFFFKKNL
jgi:hypothetical protein